MRLALGVAQVKTSGCYRMRESGKQIIAATTARCLRAPRRATSHAELKRNLSSNKALKPAIATVSTSVSALRPRCQTTVAMSAKDATLTPSRNAPPCASAAGAGLAARRLHENERGQEDTECRHQGAGAPVKHVAG